MSEDIRREEMDMELDLDSLEQVFIITDYAESALSAAAAAY